MLNSNHTHTQGANTEKEECHVCQPMPKAPPRDQQSFTRNRFFSHSMMSENLAHLKVGGLGNTERAQSIS